MSKRVIILRAAGINCDEETAYAWELAGATAERVHIQRVIDSPTVLDQYDAMTIPGGFSYGDDVAAGRIFANQLIHHLGDALRRFVERGRPILGICNGFQILVRAGLLPAINGERRPSVTLANNDSGRFETRWIHLKTCTDRCVFLPSGTRLALPIAHGEGKLVPADEATLAALRNGGYIALRYCDEDGNPGPFPINPNGSVDDIAGLTDKTGLILGLMPHPERHVHPTQHPAWSAARVGGVSDLGSPRVPSGRIIFESAVRYLAGR
jgi:phosphoribosylformylglycinamidine synthase I